MRCMTRVIAGLSVFWMLLPAALPAGENDQSQREQVEILFRLTQMEHRIQESVDALVQAELQRNPQLQGNKQALQDFLEKYIGWQALQEDIAQMYMQTFSLQELKQMNAFYITPTGQKVLTDVPRLVQQRNRLAMSRLQQHIGELQELVGKEAVP